MPFFYMYTDKNKDIYLPIYEEENLPYYDEPLELTPEDLKELGLLELTTLELEIFKYNIAISKGGSTAIIYYDIC